MTLATAARHLPHLLWASPEGLWSIGKPSGWARLLLQPPARLPCGGAVCCVASGLAAPRRRGAPGPDTTPGPRRQGFGAFNPQGRKRTDNSQGSGAATASAPAAQRCSFSSALKKCTLRRPGPSRWAAAPLLYLAAPSWRRRSTTAARQANGSPNARLLFNGAPPVCVGRAPPRARRGPIARSSLFQQVIFRVSVGFR